MTTLSEFQEQILMHPDVTLYGPSHEKYAHFALKHNWATFGISNEVFPGVRAGEPLPARSDNDVQWVWPHEIVSFLWNVPGGFLPVLASAPKAVYEFFRAVIDNGGLSQETARQFVRNDIGSWRQFFATLGSDHRFIDLRPDWAKWCRYFGGVGPMPSTAQRMDVAELDDPRIRELVALIALGLGIVVAATVSAIGMIITVIGTAVTIAVAFPPAAPAMIVISVCLIVLAGIGWALSVALAIIYMAVQGSLIFNPGTELAEVQALAS
ncbi:MAG TPA: hypothetical protein VHW00_06295 [Thermoanaerobaculia bacterium]|nr:hypothetical protein [Thermoanaerobaculia bacterium]